MTKSLSLSLSHSSPKSPAAPSIEVQTPDDAYPVLDCLAKARHRLVVQTQEMALKVHTIKPQSWQDQ